MNSTLNIVVPMAGRGSRFAYAGYDLPKPLIDVKGFPMIQYVVGNLRPTMPHRFIFIVLAEHIQRYSVEATLHRLAPGSIVLPLDGVTEGAACTVLTAKEHIDTDAPMMIANSDQWVDVDIDDYLQTLDSRNLDGLIMTMAADHPKWSYVRLDDGGAITEVVEKQVVSNEATVGIYNYRHGRQFVEAAESMIARNFRVNNEFYVAPAYNEMIAEGKMLGYYNIGTVDQGMYGLGTPEDLEKFLEMDISEKARVQASLVGD